MSYDRTANRSTYQSSSFQSSALKTDPRDYQTQAHRQTFLKWSSLGEGREDIVVSANSDSHELKNLRNILLSLSEEFNIGGQSNIIFSGDKKEDFSKRLILLENEIEGLMKRKIYFAAHEGDGSRNLDYTYILNQKQTQIVELQKKINNLQERLRRASAREIELENQITRLYSELKRKEEIIISKNQIILAEVAFSNSIKDSYSRLRRNLDQNRSRMGDLERVLLEGVNFPEIGSFEIKSEILTSDGAKSRSSSYSSLSEGAKYKTQLIQLFRQFERVNSSEGINDLEIEKQLQGFLLGLPNSRLRESVELSIKRRKIEEDYLRLQEQFSAAVSIMQSQIDKFKLQNPSLRWQFDAEILKMLREHRINVYKTAGDILHLERFSEKVVEVPVQDARTKHLMHLLAVQMKTFTAKYPKLIQEMDVRLTEFFQQELIDIIEVDQMERLVEIVKYVPQVVKVENVYAYSSEKSRKVEFHLRVLVKALLEELEKLKIKTGAVLEIDEGVIGMINEEIMGVVNVDDILKVFRVVPKIVEVEKIVEKVVDRVIEVPSVVTVDRIQEKIVPVQKIKQIEKTVNIPIEVPNVILNHVEKIVPVNNVVEKVIQVPQIIDRIVEVVKEVPKVVTVDRIIEKEVEVEVERVVEKVVNHIEPQVQVIEKVQQKIVPVQKVVERVVEVPVIVQKVVEKVLRIPEIIEVEKVVEKVVPVVEYRNAKEIENHVEVRHQVVEQIVEKPVPIIQTIEKVVEVPQIKEKIITVNNTKTEIKEIEVIRDRFIDREIIKEVEKIIEKPVTLYKEVPKEVQKIVQVPVIQEVVRKVTEIVEKPIVQRLENTVIKQVQIKTPVIVHEPKIHEVETIVNHYIEVPKPYPYVEQKIVEVVKHIDRIKEIKVPIEKIIEKMVEVPKVVEVQKIVQKVVVVPRVIEKVVEVPQIVERVVPKIVVEERVKEVERTVTVPVIQDKIKQVETVKNNYVEVEKIVEIEREKLVQVPKYEEKVITQDIHVEKVVEVVKEIPREIPIQKIVYNSIDVPQVVEIQNTIPVPIEVPMPVEKIIEKIVPTTEIIEKVIAEPQIIEKIIPEHIEQVQFKEIPQIIEKVVVDTRVQEVVKEVPYITEKVKEVPTTIQKIVPMKQVVQDIKIAQEFVEKVVEKVNIVPKIVEVQRIKEQVVEVPKIVEVEKIIPQIMKVNKYIHNIVEKIVQVPIVLEQIKEVNKEEKVVVQVNNEIETVKEVEKLVENTVVQEKFKEVVRNVNYIEKVLEVVDRVEQIPVQVISHQEKLVEVPYILQKIVEKVVVMPQIVEVLKYVHEVVEEETLGVAVNVDIATHEQKYKLLTKDIKANLDVLLVEIRKLKTSNPGLRIQIEIIQKFLSELQKFILFPRIVEVPKEKIVQKIVEKEKVVTLPKDSERTVKMELTLSILVQKLILELKRLKSQNPGLKLDLDEDVNLIFFSELESSSKLVGSEFNASLKSFSDSIYRKFESLGSWSFDHQMMLNSFIQQRFLMSNLVKNANLEIEKLKATSHKREEVLKRYESDVGILQGYVSKFKSGLVGLTAEQESVFNNIYTEFNSYISFNGFITQTKYLGDLDVNDARYKSLIRTKEEEILRLRSELLSLNKSTLITEGHATNRSLQILQDENSKLRNEISQLRVEKGSTEMISSYKTQVQQLNDRILELEREKSNLQAELFNLKEEFKVKGMLDSPVAKYEFQSPNTRVGSHFKDSEIGSAHRPTGESLIEKGHMVDSRHSSTGGPSYQNTRTYGNEGTHSNVQGSGLYGQNTNYTTNSGHFQSSTGGNSGTNSGEYGRGSNYGNPGSRFTGSGYPYDKKP